MTSLRRHAHAGFTLIELMVGLAVMAVLAFLVAPSFRDMIDMQRLRSTSAQFVTDVQYARSEAISRQQRVAIELGGNASMTCYIIHTCGYNVPESQCTCDCTQPAGSRCNPNMPPVELRTVVVSEDQKIGIIPTVNPNGFTISFILFSALDGSMQPWNIGFGGAAGRLQGPAWADVILYRDFSNQKALRTMISQGGRPSVCTPSGSLVSGATPCQ